VHGPRPLVAGPAVQDVAEHHGARSDQQGRAQRDLHVLLLRRTAAKQVQEVGAEERGWHRAKHHPADQAQVDGALAKVHRRPDRPHQHGGDQVTGDSGGWFHTEQQDQHRRHQRAAARSGQPDEQADHRAAQHDVRVEAHNAPG